MKPWLLVILLRSPELEYIEDHDASPTHVILVSSMQARFGFCWVCGYKVEGRTQVESRQVDSHGFEETELSNPDNDQDLESGGSENGDIMEKFQQHARVLSINQEKDLGHALRMGKGYPYLKQILSFSTNNGLVSLAKVSAPLESLQLEECHIIIQYGVSSELHQRVYMFLHPTL